MWASFTTAERTIAGAAAVTFIAAFLPWASVFGFSVAGTNGDGIITLFVALIGLGFLAMRARFAGRRRFIVELVLGLIVAAVGVADLRSVSAIGLYLTLIAGIVWAAAAIVGLRAPTTSPGPLAG